MTVLGIPPEILAILPLSLAAGVDLYLTLLILGAAPTLGWWPPLPGALGYLDSVGVLLVVGAFYVLEFAAERSPVGALVWNVFHALIRPVAGGLLALLLLAGHPAAITVPGALIAAVLASTAHATATGGSFLLWLSGPPRPHPLLVSLAEDVGVLGLVALTLDLPGWAAVVALVVGVSVSRVAGSQIRAFAFTIRLARGAVTTLLGRGRWTDPDDFPSWVSWALREDVTAPGGLRGCAAAARRLPGAPRFVLGWIVVRGDTPLLLYRRLTRTVAVELGRMDARGVSEETFFRRVDLEAGAGAPVRVYFPLDGPAPEAIASVFS